MPSEFPVLIIYYENVQTLTSTLKTVTPVMLLSDLGDKTWSRISVSSATSTSNQMHKMLCSFVVNVHYSNFLCKGEGRTFLQ